MLVLHSINWRLDEALLLQLLHGAFVSNEVDSRADNTLSLAGVLCRTQKSQERSTRQSSGAETSNSLAGISVGRRLDHC